MGYGFDQHLENLGVTGWAILILLSAVAYLYYENKDLRQSKNSIVDYLRVKHEAEIKKFMESKESTKPVMPIKSKSDPKGSYIDCDFDETTPF